MSSTTVWRSRWRDASLRLVDFLGVVVICLLSELIIWGLSQVLAPVNLEFFASILGMLLLFCFMTVASWIWPSLDEFYREHIRPKVNFINSHLGIGFLIPIVTLSQSNILGGHDILCIIGTFASSNAASWTAVFSLALLAMMVIRSLEARIARAAGSPAVALSRRIRLVREAMTGLGCRFRAPTVASSSSSTTVVPETTPHLDGRDSTEQESSSAELPKPGAWNLLMSNCTFMLLISGTFAVGLPVALATGDERLLDGFVLCSLWISAVRLQRFLKASSMLKPNARAKGVFATLMHPILTTTLLMVAYTRGKAAAMEHSTIDKVLKTLSSGTPLHVIWNWKVTGVPIPHNQSAWFGAGDAALSLLECGMVAWGFKLYECRGQLFSTAGALTTMLCVAAAAGNVFVSVIIARGIGLHAHEALAFAARSVTLALAKPAVHALGGSVVVNATLVVSNGTLGQLVYPFVLDRLGVKRESGPATGGGGRADSSETLAAAEDAVQLPHDKVEEALGSENRGRDSGGSDDAVTVAAGVAIGINGAAMGVSYLYETGSRAAPYAVLAMTVFGVMTVVFMTVEPFKGLVLHLAGN